MEIPPDRESLQSKPRTSRHLVDPELLPILNGDPALDLSRESLRVLRKSIFDQALDASQAIDQLPSGNTVWVPGPDGAPPVRVLHYAPLKQAGLRPAVMHLHGGGFVFGLPEMRDRQLRELALDVGCSVISVDYRLAPETTYPGALEDCYAVLRWMHRNATGLQIDTSRIALKGESAGAGLAAALTLLVRDRSEFAIAYQQLNAPMLDDRTAVLQGVHPYNGEYVWTQASNLFGWTSYLGCTPGDENISQYAAAARATDLSKLPPAFISVGSLDLFLEEDLEYARRLNRAGVPIELHVYPGAFHGFHMVQDARVTIAATRDSRDAIRRALSRSA